MRQLSNAHIPSNSLIFLRAQVSGRAASHKQSDLLAERAQLLSEFQAGVWTKDEYHNMVHKLVKKGKEHPNKRPRISEPVAGPSRIRADSVEWDAENSSLPSSDID